jgi:hypothetical protein
MIRPGIVRHPAFLRGNEGLLRALVTDVRGQLVFVIGLSGSGKSEIRYASMPIYAGSPSTWGKGQLPVIAVRAAPTDRSNFSSKEFVTRLYLQMFEPDLGWLARRSEVEGPDGVHSRTESRLAEPFWKDMRRAVTEHQLRLYFERMATVRGLKAIFVEEAASMTFTHSQKKPVDHMINYMCLAEEIGVTIVLFGVPKIAALWEGNAEIRRRSRFVFVDRYRISNTEGRTHFERLVISLAQSLRLSTPDLLRRNLDLAYAASVGVYGELKGYLTRADDLRAAEGAESIRKKHLEEAIYSDDDLTTLHSDAAAFDKLCQPANAAAIRALVSHAP